MSTTTKGARLAELEAKTREIALLLKSAMPQDAGFILAICDFGDGEDGWFTYMSSVERAGAIKLLRRLLGRLEVQ